MSDAEDLRVEAQKMVGVPNQMGSVTFDETMVSRFLEAAGDELSPEGAIPPLIAMAFVGDLPMVRTNWKGRGFLAGQVFWPQKPLKIGDEVISTTTLADVYEKTGRSGALLFLVWDTVLTNQDGDEVARCRRSFARMIG